MVFKNLVVHPQVVTDAHRAGCAAAKQGKFVAYKNAFWEKAYGPYQATHDQSKLGLDNIMVIAKDLGLDTAKLKTDMEGAECKALIEGDMAELQKFKVGSTPAFFINGRPITGAMPKAAFKTIIDERLKVAEASGVPGGSYYDKEVLGKGDKQFKSKMDRR